MLLPREELKTKVLDICQARARRIQAQLLVGDSGEVMGVDWSHRMSKRRKTA